MITLEEYKLLDTRAKGEVNKQRKALGLTPYHSLKNEPSKLRGKQHPRKGIKMGPNGTAGQPKPWLNGEQPHRWLSGPDPMRHRMYDPFCKSKAQAMYRQEGWDMTFDEFAELWQDLWTSRGRDGPDLCMTRIDIEKPWSRANCEIVTRKEVNQRAGVLKRNRRRQYGI